MTRNQSDRQVLGRSLGQYRYSLTISLRPDLDASTLQRSDEMDRNKIHVPGYLSTYFGMMGNCRNRQNCSV